MNKAVARIKQSFTFNRKLVIDVVIILLFCILSSVVENTAYNNGNFKFDYLLNKSIIKYFCIYIFIYFISLLHPKKDKTTKSSIKIAINCFIIIFLIHLLILIIFYPGVSGWDTTYQLKDWFDGYQTMKLDSWNGIGVKYNISDHMNAFDTVLFGLFAEIGMLFNNINYGIFVYCFLQVLFTSLLFSTLIYYVYKYTKSTITAYILCFFYALSPFINMYSINMIKDSLNAVIFGFYFITFLKCVSDKATKNNVIALIFLSIFVSLTKKTGLYIVCLSNLILLKINWNRKVLRTHIILSVLLPFFVITILLGKIIYPLFDVWVDDKQDSMGTFYQQTARTVYLYEKEFLYNEKKIIDNVFVYDLIKANYDYYTTDPIKGTWRIQATSRDDIEYGKLWFKYFIKHPFTYINSVIGTSSGYFVKDKPFYIYWNFNDWANLGIVNNNLFSSIRYKYYLLYNSLSSMRLIKHLFQTFIYTWVIPFITLLKNRTNKKMIHSLVPIIFGFATFIISPLVNSRYAIHIIYLAPFLFFIEPIMNNKE